jgi:hypothetical protein
MEVRMWSSRVETFEFTKDAMLPKVPDPFLVDGILHRSQTIMYGQTNAGKSMLALSLGVSVASGQSWLGQSVANPGPVSIVTGDPDGLHETYERLDKVRDFLGSGLINIVVPERPLARETWLEVKQAAEGSRLLVLDNLTQFVPTSLNDDGGVRLVYEQLQSIARNGTAVCVLAHTSDKRNEHGYASDIPLGSTVIRTIPRWFVYLKRARGALQLSMSGNSGRPWELTLTEPTDAPRFHVLDSAGADELAERRAKHSRNRDKAKLDHYAEIAAYVADGHTQRAAAEHFRVGVGTVSRAVQAVGVPRDQS